MIESPQELIQKKLIELLMNKKVMAKVERDIMIIFLKEDYSIETDEALSIMVSNPEWYLSLSFFYVGLKGLLRTKEHKINVEPQI